MSDPVTDIMTLEGDENASELEEALAMQRLINSGMVWRLQGSAGRAAMAMLEAGLCMLPTEPHQDYWGNTVPSRDWLVPGTKGTRELVVNMKGEQWAQWMEDA